MSLLLALTSAAADAEASGALAAVQLSAIAGGASGDVSASGAPPAVSLSAPAATASGAGGDASASGGLAAIGLSAPGASSAGDSVAIAVGDWHRFAQSELQRRRARAKQLAEEAAEQRIVQAVEAVASVPQAVKAPRARIQLSDLIGSEAAAQAQLASLDADVGAIRARARRQSQQREEEEILLMY